VTNFRNLKNQEIKLNKKINIIYGNNAQGKTNLLESIWIQTGGRSFRSTKDINLIKFGEQHAESIVNFHSKDRTQQIKTELTHEKRRVYLNSIEKTPVSNIVGEFSAVVFSPIHLSLIKDGPNIRRNFIDAAICQTKPLYTKLLSQYKHIINQRNSLLKSIKYQSTIIDTLDIWDDKLSSFGANLRYERIKYLIDLQDIINKIYSNTPELKKNLELAYRKTSPKDKESLKKELIEELKKSREEDLTRGFTSKGPHRDDIDIKLDKKPIRTFASQGEQRTAVLAIKIAEANILEKKNRRKAHYTTRRCYERT
jgi:DNA replication and repair protein RecF